MNENVVSAETKIHIQTNKKSNKKTTTKCPVSGCNGLGNKNRKIKSHRTIGGCPNFKKNSSPLFGRKPKSKAGFENLFTSESISNLTFQLKTMEIKLRETQAKLRRFENEEVFPLNKSQISTQTDESSSFLSQEHDQSAQINRLVEELDRATDKFFSNDVSQNLKIQFENSESQ